MAGQGAGGVGALDPEGQICSINRIPGESVAQFGLLCPLVAYSVGLPGFPASRFRPAYAGRPAKIPKPRLHL